MSDGVNEGNSSALIPLDSEMEDDDSLVEVDFGVGRFVGLKLHAVAPVFRDHDAATVPDRVL